MTAKKRSSVQPRAEEAKVAVRKKGHTPKVYLSTTKPSDAVPFRPTLDEHSKVLLKRLGSQWRIRAGVQTVMRLIDHYTKSVAASQPLVKFIRDTMPDLEANSFTDRDGQLFMMTKANHDDLRDLAFDTRWDVAGNMSRMLRIMIYHSAEQEGIPMPRITADEFEEQLKRKEQARIAKKKAKDRAKDKAEARPV